MWNTMAVPIMSHLMIPWGGTFAIRMNVLRETGLPDKWKVAVVEDAPVHSALKTHGKKLQFVPSLMMINREECTLGFSLDFIKRQLTWTRLYHGHWVVVLVLTALTATILTTAVLIGMAGVALNERDLVALAIAAIGAYLVFISLSTELAEAAVRSRVSARGERPWSRTIKHRINEIIALPVMLVVHLIATLLATFRREVVWRGIRYRLNGPWDIQRTSYAPYRQANAEDSDSRLSL
jgi:hypothetical protein